jgi:hypothetical protein
LRKGQSAPQFHSIVQNFRKERAIAPEVAVIGIQHSFLVTRTLRNAERERDSLVCREPISVSQCRERAQDDTTSMRASEETDALWSETEPLVKELGGIENVSYLANHRISGRNRIDHPGRSTPDGWRQKRDTESAMQHRAGIKSVASSIVRHDHRDALIGVRLVPRNIEPSVQHSRSTRTLVDVPRRELNSLHGALARHLRGVRMRDRQRVNRHSHSPGPASPQLH